MKKETLKELIATQRNIQTHIWTACMITIGGSLALVFHLNSVTDKIMCLCGFALFGFLFNVYLNKLVKIDLLTKKLNEVSDNE